jgi:hypothetical protein
MVNPTDIGSSPFGGKKTDVQFSSTVLITQSLRIYSSQAVVGQTGGGAQATLGAGAHCSHGHELEWLLIAIVLVVIVIVIQLTRLL